MNNDTNIPYSSTVKHVRYLSEIIGPRGSTTSKEVQAADYARRVMEDAGLQPKKETFTSLQSAWKPYTIAAAMLLTAEILFLGASKTGAGLATLLTILVLVSLFLELTFQENPLRWLLTRGRSQNVWARIPPVGQIRQRLVIVGHLDSHRTPWVFSKPKWPRIFKWLVPTGLAAMAISMIIFLIGIFSPWTGWRAISVLPAMVPLGILVLTLEADLTPYTPGANDNASGAGMVLSLAARLNQQQLEHTEIWALCSGCEEVGCYGAADFIARHRDELLPPQDLPGLPGRAFWITLDAVGGPGAQVCYLSRHTFLQTARSDAELLRLADGISARRPELEAQKKSLTGAYTESHIAAAADLRVLTFINLDRDGTVPHWHRPTDAFCNLNKPLLQKTEEFVWDLLREVDKLNP